MGVSLNREQNKRTREAARALVLKYKDNISAAARSIGMTPGWLSKFIDDDTRGASHQSATAIAVELGMDPKELLGEFASVSVSQAWSQLPGYREALTIAKQMVDYPEQVWVQLSVFTVSPTPPRVTPIQLANAARLIASILPVAEEPGGSATLKTARKM